MKLTFIMLLAASLQAGAFSGYAQRISLNVKEVPLEAVFKAISDQTQLNFIYDVEVLAKADPVTLNVKRADFKTVLNACFRGQPLSYKILNQTIVVSESDQSQKNESKTAVQQTNKVSGIVSDEQGEPLIGVSVTIKGSGKGTLTNATGEFSLLLSKDDVLLLSYLGFKNKEVVYTGQERLNIMLEIEAAGLNEVVVVGFGRQKKASLTGSVSQINSDALENRPTANLGQALQGLMPNLNVNISNGSPNTNATFNVRGGTSFAKNNNGNIVFQTGAPFILVDGVEMDPSLLNPEDIESVTLLKDAASAAIYGARAAFGVLMITTKSGSKSGKSNINYSNSFQWSKPTAVPAVLDAYTIQDAIIKAAELEGRSAGTDQLVKLQKIREYLANPENLEPYYFTDSLAAVPNNIEWIGNINPYKEALLNYSPLQKHNLSFSGGTEKYKYYSSLGYQDQDGLYRINTDNFKRYNLMLNISSQMNNWFNLNFRSSYNNSVYTEPVNPAGKGGWWTALSQDPGRNVNMPVHVPVSLGVRPLYTDNILSFMEYGSSDKEVNSRLLFTLSPTLSLTKNWNLKGDFSYLKGTENQKTVVPILERLEGQRNASTKVHTNPDYISKYNNLSNKYTVNIYTDYNKTIAKHHQLSGLIGFNQEWYNDQELTARRDNINNSVPVLSQAQGERTVNDSEEHWAVRGFFYRLKYNYQNKYLLESNGRYDGTSRFASGSRFKFFPSVSAAWRISEESFASGIKPYVNDLKIRGSYGSLGNQNINNYAYILNYGTDSQIDYLLAGVLPVGITPPGLISPFLTWETASTIDFGFDLVAFNNFEITFDWYKRTTKDILTDGIKYPATLGASSPQVNSGSLETKGWELILKYRKSTDYGLHYDLAGNIGDFQSEVVKFDNNPNNIISNATIYKGQMMGEIWGYETYGIFQNQKEVDNAPNQGLISSGQWFPGDIRYANLNGDTVISAGSNTLADPGDRRIIGNSTPRYQFGLNSNFRYKNFDLNVFLQGVGKRDLWIGNNLYWGAGTTGTWEVYNNSWTPERTEAFYPAYKNAGRNREIQTRYLENGAYLRMKNLTLGYTLPKQIAGRIAMQRIRLSASAFNLFELKSVPDTFDPELVSLNYPVMRSFAFGLQATF